MRGSVLPRAVLSFLVFCCCTQLVVANLVRNGDFSRPLAEGWGGGPYGGGPGLLEIAGDDPHAHLVKERGPGATQMLGNVPIGTNSHFRVSFRHRGLGAAFGWYYVHPVDGRLTAINDAVGKRVGGYENLPPSADWTNCVKDVAVPSAIASADLVVTLQFSVWGGNSPSELDVDDVKLVAYASLPEPPPPPPVRVSLRRCAKIEGYGPIPVSDPHAFTCEDGILKRDGRPFFFVGNGCEFGSSQSSAVGMWAAKLLGYSAISLEPGGGLRVAARDGTNVTVEGTCMMGEYSRFREATRLGFLVDFFGNGVYRWSPLRPLAETQPDFKEVHYDHGHYINTDTGYRLGRAMQLAKRQAFCQYLDDSEVKPIVEFCREPGPEPTNQRVRRDFRKWAARKYGSLTVANAVWRKNFGRWDDVLPPHLEDRLVSGWMKRITLMELARKESPEMYWDWLRFMQDDFTACVKNERDDMKRACPTLPLTIDCRSHNNTTDGYCVLDPERIDPLFDLFFIHFGCHSFVYNDEPYHLPTLLDQTSFPLFSYNFFRTNTRHPIINSEDIVGRAVQPKSDKESMRRNDLAHAHDRKWRFRLETNGENGLALGWEKPDLDDSGWDEMSVPGCWDEGGKYDCKSGVAWYRLRFRCEADRLNYEDGSHNYCLYGKGVAQSGRIWLNGEYVGEVRGWDTEYRFDIGAKLRFRAENELVFRVDGNGFKNGLRFYCHVLPNDRISKAVRFGPRQYRLMLWPYLMQGTSGVMVWSWHTDYMRPYFPELVRKLEVASDVVLPDLRFRRHKVAYLFPFLGARGLPCTITGTHEDYLNWLDALEFSGIRPDVFGERHFVNEVTPQSHPLLVVPYANFVEDGTYSHFKKYVEGGGTAMVTDDSLTRTYRRWETTDIRSYAAMDGSSAVKVTRRGRGRVVYVRGRPKMEELMEILSPFLPKASVTVSSSERGERPLIERVFAGSETRKVLYLGNWGGCDHPLEVRIPEGYGDWRMTDLEGHFRRTGDRTFSVTVPSQDVAALLLEDPKVSGKAATAVSDARLKALERIEKLLEEKAGDASRPTALWPSFRQSHGVTPVSAELFPYVLDRIDAFGCRSVVEPIENWTPETLRRHRMVVLPETNTQQFYRKKDWTAFADMIRGYVRDGGSVLVLVNTAYAVNCYGNLLSWNGFGPHFGVSKGGVARDGRHAAFGDPFQIESDDVAEGVLSECVRKVLLYYHEPMRFEKGSQARSVVRIPGSAEKGAGLNSMATLELGKGRMFFSADAMAFQPYRISEADNAALLENVIGWLLHESVSQAMRDEFKRDLFIEAATIRCGGVQ